MIRVLIVDDHPVMRSMFRSMLAEHAGLEIVGEAGDGLAALEAAQRCQPDVALMDVSMPRLDGLEATRRLRAQHPQVAVIGLTMFDEAALLARFRAAGAVAIHPKDGEVAALVALIRQVAGQAAEQRSAGSGAEIRNPK